VFTPEFKRQVVQQIQKGEKTLAELSRELDIYPTVILCFANTPSAPQVIDPEVVLRQHRVRTRPGGAVLDSRALASRPSLRGRPSFIRAPAVRGSSGIRDG
jgi:hypothetical protein